MAYTFLHTPVVYILLGTAKPSLLRVIPGSLLSILSMSLFAWFTLTFLHSSVFYLFLSVFVSAGSASM
ncbi:hypothetical protein P692DRAFT_20826034 [Suillus brevipes Sb2]|nr:hypothetical protein P692DRAFT_20826034 [Suillus brevipes Sb2]